MSTSCTNEVDLTYDFDSDSSIQSIEEVNPQENVDFNENERFILRISKTGWNGSTSAVKVVGPDKEEEEESARCCCEYELGSPCLPKILRAICEKSGFRCT